MVFRRLNTVRCGFLLAVIISIGWLVAGCATTPEPPPGPTADEVGQRLAALQDCINRSQRTVDAALNAGVSAGNMAPANSAIGDALDAADEAQKLLQDGKNQEAMDRLNQALEECNKIEAMARKASDDFFAEAERAKMLADAEERIGQITPCVENARRAIDSAKAAGASDMDLRAAENALGNAEFILKEAKDLLANGEAKAALTRLDIAESDCLSARDMANQAGIAAANRMQAKPDDYRVVRGDTLWGISGSAPIYDNPFMWPLIYKANRGQIRDPDLIYPDQVFSIPRNYSQEEAGSAVRRAKTRGPWRLGDGPDYYILEGVRR